MLNETGIPEENKGQMIEDKYIKKIEWIEEVDSEESEEEFDEKQKPLERKSVHEIISAEEQKEDSLMNEADIPAMPNLAKKQSSTNSFTVIGKEEIIDDFDHISNFDPDDEFLHND